VILEDLWRACDTNADDRRDDSLDGDRSRIRVWSGDLLEPVDHAQDDPREMVAGLSSPEAGECQ
jgi:hypothetical protein